MVPLAGRQLEGFPPSSLVVGLAGKGRTTVGKPMEQSNSLAAAALDTIAGFRRRTTVGSSCFPLASRPDCTAAAAVESGDPDRKGAVRSLGIAALIASRRLPASAGIRPHSLPSFPRNQTSPPLRMPPPVCWSGIFKLC